MEGLRARPLERLGKSPVVRVVDGAAGEERVEGAKRPLDLPQANLMIFESADGARLTARPSGTEPKIKFYLELVGAAGRPADVAPARARLEAEGQALRRELMRELRLE
jgi:phosphomannomutase